MSEKRIVYTSAEGNCCVIIPVMDCGLSIGEIALKDVPAGLKYRIVDVDKLPKDREFRNAWTDELDTDTVDIDIAKAKNIKRDKLREIRAPMLVKCDLDFMKSLETDDKKLKKDSTLKKQALRDVTSLELPDDIEELKKFMPDILLEVK